LICHAQRLCAFTFSLKHILSVLVLVGDVVPPLQLLQHFQADDNNQHLAFYGCGTCLQLLQHTSSQHLDAQAGALAADA
jgi:hypothetical protein